MSIEDWGYVALITFMLAIVVGVIGLLGLMIYEDYQNKETCLRGHNEKQHVAANTWVQMIPAGKGVVIPIVHNVPEHDAEVFVCDERKPEHD